MKRTMITTAILLSALTFAVPAQAKTEIIPTKIIPEVLPGTFHTEVPQAVLDLVESTFTEGEPVDPIFTDPALNPNLYLASDSDVLITFIDEAAAYLNTVGYVAWQPGQLDGFSFADLDKNGKNGVSIFELANATGADYGLLFPNASRVGDGGKLETGSSIYLAGGKVFSADTRISLFLMQDAWDPNKKTVKGFGNKHDNDNAPQTFYTLDFLNPENPDGATIDNPGSDTRHAAMLFEDASQNAVLIGMEDLNLVDPSSNPWGLTNDGDYNDVVLRLQAPMGGDIPTAPAPLAGGGLAGLAALISMIGAARKRKASL
ncbi:MAG: DUF4114 domain-containing protein [Pseudomonadota bacterium]|nr:DUF4114 domain-containing protein [Pseudomonadota bacterium]